MNHEKWVQDTIDNAINAGKYVKPKFLTRITSGKELFNIMADSYGYRTDYDEVENEADTDFIGGVLQDLVDYGDLIGMVETYDRVKMAFQLNGLLKNLEQKGYYLFGGKGIERVKFGNGESDTWSIATLVIKKKDSSDIIKVDLEKSDKNASA